MTTRWGIALCVLLALFANSVRADVFDDVASFVKDSEAVKAFKEKLFDEDYVEDVGDKLKVVADNLSSAVSSEATEPNSFPMLFEGTVLNDFTGVKEEAMPVDEAEPRMTYAEAVSKNLTPEQANGNSGSIFLESTAEPVPEIAQPQDWNSRQEPKEEQEQEQIFKSLQAALENSAAELEQSEEQMEEMADEQTEALAQELEQALDQEEEQQGEMQLELEKLPVAIINFLQDAVETVAAEQEEDTSAMMVEEPQPCDGMGLDEYCSSVVKTCEMETCANQPVTENSCVKTEEGYQTACACGEASSASSNSISSGSFSSSSSGFDFPRGMPDPPIDLMRSMFARRFGPRPTFSDEAPQFLGAPRGVPLPLMSLIRPFAASFGGMPPFLNGRMAPRMTQMFVRPSIEFSSGQEEEQEQGPAEVDLSELQQGAGMFPQPEFRPLSFMRAFPVRFSVFRQMQPQETQVPELRIAPRTLEEPPAFIKDIISNMANNFPEDEPQPVQEFAEPQSEMYPAVPLPEDPNSIQAQVNDLKKEWLKKQAWLKNEEANRGKKEDSNWGEKEDWLKKEEWKGDRGYWKEGRQEKEDRGEKKEGGWRHDDNDHHFGGREHHRMEGGPHHPPAVLCFLVMAGVVLAATLTCCCCTRRPRTYDDGEQLMVDVIGVDGYTPLMNTCIEQETNPEMKPLMPLDFEEPIKAQVK